VENIADTDHHHAGDIQFTKQALHTVMVNFMNLSFKRVSTATRAGSKWCANMFKLTNNVSLQEFVTYHFTNFAA
jgi:hypothetical protein